MVEIVMVDSDATGDVERLIQLREEYVEAENAGDIDGILRTFSDDIVVMPPESPPVKGIEAAKGFLGDFLDAFTVDLELVSEDVVVDGDLAYDWGTVSGTLEPDGGQPQPVSNTYLLVYQRNSDGSWRQSKHIWNANE
jgi:ketosteroid isomerase-like protein